MNLAPAPHDFDAWVEHLSVPHRRDRARHHLVLAGTPALPAIRRGLHHTDPAVRRACTSILDHLVDDESLPDLVAALDDDDPWVCAHALHALACDRCKEGECRPGEDLFVPRAMEIVRSHPRSRVRAAAVDALGKVVHRPRGGRWTPGSTSKRGCSHAGPTRPLTASAQPSPPGSGS